MFDQAIQCQGGREISITEQTTLEDRLAELTDELFRARRQLTEAQSLAKIGSWEWDIPRNVVWWSDELYRIYGLEPHSIEPSYEGFLKYVHPEDRESVDARNQKAFADHQPFADIKRVVRADDREILMHTAGDVVVGDDGAPLRMIGVCEDVTDRERAWEAERRLAASADVKRRSVQLNDELIGRLDACRSKVEAGDRTAKETLDEALDWLRQANDQLRR